MLCRERHADGLPLQPWQDRSGFNVGGGVERALDRHWIARAEYIYDGFGDQTYAGDGAEWNNRRLTISDNTVRAAIGYKF